jgi:hypothetical protein
VVDLVGLGAQQPDQLVHLADGRTAGLLDGRQRLPAAGRVALEHVAGRGCLHADAGDVVGDDVVEVAGDPQPLVHDRPPGAQVALPAQLLGLLLQQLALPRGAVGGQSPGDRAEEVDDVDPQRDDRDRDRGREDPAGRGVERRRLELDDDLHQPQEHRDDHERRPRQQGSPVT